MNLYRLLENLDPEIDSMPDPEGFLIDPNNWISCTVISELYKRARLILDDEMIAFKIARFAVEKTSLGYVQAIVVKALWSTKKVLNNLQKLNDKWNRNKKVELVEVKRNGAIVRLHWHHRMDVSKDICLYNQGVYSFMSLIWGGEPLELKEESCYFEGGPYCEYHLKWPSRNQFHEIYSRFFTSKSVLTETIKEMEADKNVIEQKYEEVNRLNVELYQKIKQLQAIQETGKAILSVLDLEKLLNVIMNTLSNVCRIDRAIIMVVNEKEERLEYLYATGFNKDVPDEILKYNVPLHRVNNILVRVTNTGKPEYVHEVESSSLRKKNIVLAYGKPTSVYVVPLITRSKVIGVIATDAVDGAGVPRETREILEVFSPQIAIAIENARLYKRLQEQMLELKKSYTLLSRAEKLSFLGNLAARLAHEIKNPMTAIGTFIQMLPYKYNDEEYRGKFHKIVVEETNRVNNLISELMDLVNTRESKFELNDIHELIDKMVLLVSPQSKAKKIEVNCLFDQGIGQVWLDSEKMKQVILNLLSNAVDFTDEKGKIEISTKHNNNKGDKGNIQIYIKDNGKGIPRSNIDKIFDPYFTTKYKSNMHKGTGLGLFISHQKMQDHGGTIEVKSTVNKGTTFILTLPVNPSEEILEQKKSINSE
ncbi:ATP-binding protein [Deltaproteobacteria bacterium]|nr:ATP-binding protein [Deltaproteobacteria bacterium]